jgi:hypothetical protein
MISRTTFFAIVAAFLLTTGFAVAPQESRAADEPGKAIVSLYRVAPGKHRDFLKWFAAREALNKEAGVAATQWYVHVNGDSWDFITVGPELSEAQSAKLDELASKKGLTTGFKGALELREYLGSHTDTSVRGPVSAAQLLQLAGSN